MQDATWGCTGHRGPCWGHVGTYVGAHEGSPGGVPRCLAQLKPASGCSVPASDLCVRAPRPSGHAPPTRAFPAAPPAVQSREVLPVPRRGPCPRPCHRWDPVSRTGRSLCSGAESQRSVSGQRSEQSSMSFQTLRAMLLPCVAGALPPSSVGGEGEQWSPVLWAQPLRGGWGEGGWPPVHLLLPPPCSPSRWLPPIFPSARLDGAGHSHSARLCAAAPHPTPLRTGGSSPLLLPWAWHRPVTSTACNPAGTSAGPTQMACAQRRTQCTREAGPRLRTQSDTGDCPGTATLPFTDHGFALVSQDRPSPAPRLREVAPRQDRLLRLPRGPAFSCELDSTWTPASHSSK